jgi:hypothetical protein
VQELLGFSHKYPVIMYLGSLLASNELTGGIPSELCAVTTLTSFDARDPSLVCS